MSEIKEIDLDIEGVRYHGVFKFEDQSEYYGIDVQGPLGIHREAIGISTVCVEFYNDMMERWEESDSVEANIALEEAIKKENGFQ